MIYHSCQLDFRSLSAYISWQEVGNMRDERLIATNPEGFDARCSWCRERASHTSAEHLVEVAIGNENLIGAEPPHSYRSSTTPRER